MTDEQLIIGVYRRVSTRHQAGNERFEGALDDMTEYVQRFGYAVRPYDEGIRSGAHLSNRRVASRMIADLKNGVIHGIAAPDVSRLTRGEWMEGGAAFGKALLASRGVLITRTGLLDLRRPRDYDDFQQEVLDAARERRKIARRFWEGHYDRARKTVDDGDEPFGRHRTMMGYRLEMLFDERGQPRVSRRGQVKRGLVKDPYRVQDMRHLLDALDATHTTAELYAALRSAGVQGPSTAVAGGWTARELATLLHSPLHRGVWHFVRTIGDDATVWFGLDPRQDEFDPRSVVRDVPKLAYWTGKQADAWYAKFFVDHKPSRGRHAFDHPLLGLLRCPVCHELLVGKGKFGYMCPNYRAGTGHGFSTIRESTAQLILLGLVPQMQAEIDNLRAASRAWLQQRQDGGIEVQLEALDNRERRILDQVEETGPSTVSTERLKTLYRERQQLLSEQTHMEKVSDARLEAERALARLGDDALAMFAEVSMDVRAALYAGFYEWVEIAPAGPGHSGGRIVDLKIHNQHEAGTTLLMDLLRQLERAA
jgi:hypothetical protein